MRGTHILDDPKNDEGGDEWVDHCGAEEAVLNFINRAPIIALGVIEALQTFHEEDGGQSMIKAPYYQAPSTDPIAYNPCFGGNYLIFL